MVKSNDSVTFLEVLLFNKAQICIDPPYYQVIIKRYKNLRSVQKREFSIEACYEKSNALKKNLRKSKKEEKLNLVLSEC